MQDISGMSDEEVIEQYNKMVASGEIRPIEDAEDEACEDDVPRSAHTHVPVHTHVPGQAVHLSDKKPEVVDWDLDVQRDFINLCVYDQYFMLQAAKLFKPEYFGSDILNVIFSVCVEYFAKYGRRPAPHVLRHEVISRFTGSTAVLAMSEIAECTSEDRTALAARGRDYVFNEMVKFARYNAIKASIYAALVLMQKADWDGIATEFRNALSVAPDVNLGTHFYRDAELRYQRMTASVEGDAFPSGFDSIDRELNGGIRRKELAMIFAPPGVGKSLWLSHVAMTNARAGKKVLYVSLEMDEDRVANRMDSAITRIPISATIARRNDVISRLAMVRAVYPQEIIIKQFPPGAMTADDLRAYMVQLSAQEEFVPDIVVVDYLDEMASPPKLESYEAQMRMCRSLRAIAVESNVAVYTATQSSRKGREVEIITDAEIGDSYGKVRIVDAMWSINQKDEEKVVNLARVFVVKQRNGRSRYQFCIFINPLTLAMREIPESLYAKMMDPKTGGIAGLTKEEREKLDIGEPATVTAS